MKGVVDTVVLTNQSPVKCAVAQMQWNSIFHLQTKGLRKGLLHRVIQGSSTHSVGGKRKRVGVGALPDHINCTPILLHVCSILIQ